MDCGYIRHNGLPCKRQVKQGFTRCNRHGGNTPIAKAKAEQMLALLRMPAIEALHDILDQYESNTCATCGFPTGEFKEKKLVLATCRAILDRTGLGPRSTLEVKQSDGDLDMGVLNEAERGEMLSLLAQFKALKERVRLRVHQTAFGTTTTVAQSNTIQ